MNSSHSFKHLSKHNSAWLFIRSEKKLVLVSFLLINSGEKNWSNVEIDAQSYESCDFYLLLLHKKNRQQHSIAHFKVGHMFRNFRRKNSDDNFCTTGDHPKEVLLQWTIYIANLQANSSHCTGCIQSLSFFIRHNSSKYLTITSRLKCLISLRVFINTQQKAQS